jgi:hypothetical protein
MGMRADINCTGTLGESAARQIELSLQIHGAGEI